MIRRAVFYLNHVKTDVFQTAKECAAVCRRYGIAPLLLSADEEAWRTRFSEEPPETVDMPAQADAIFVFGGDGTVLRAMDEYVELGRPFLGINLGRLGFLPEVQTGEMDAAIERVSRGAYTLEHRMMLHRIRRKGMNLKHMMMVGCSAAAEGYIDRIRQNPQWGYQVHGILDDNTKKGSLYDGVPVLGGTDELEHILSENNLDEIAITLSLSEYYKLKRIVA